MAVEWKEFVLEKDDDLELHYIPTDAEHAVSAGCWCNPELKFDAEEAIRAYKHHRIQ